MAHAGGRPTKYDPSFIKIIDEYMKTTGGTNMRLPKRIDVALLLDVDEDTLNNWAKVHPELLGALTRVDGMQKSQLMDDGMYGGKEINARVAQFLLSANHGMREKSDVTTDGEKIQGPTVFIPKETDG